ncbi:SH3 domain-binding protein 5-like protein [Intoshia linei]|uniref:SH3 domain-binding protein 5-like protein n=1 Tax=Intoshia linei TaxID=1819745 RepID=A0A177BC66_9BILA|nr:SH3 domain-binding protein 5-like protein [Intoshia linei]
MNETILKESSVIYLQSISHNVDIRDDYRELLELSLMFHGMFRKKFHMDNEILTGIRELCIFFSTIYVIQWFNCIYAAEAALSDLQLYKNLQLFQVHCIGVAGDMTLIIKVMFGIGNVTIYNVNLSCSIKMTNSAEFDPNIKFLMDKMNTSTEEINDFENKILVLQTDHDRILRDTNVQLKSLYNSQKTSIKMTETYYELLSASKEIRLETTKAASDFHNAIHTVKISQHNVRQAELRFKANKSNITAQHDINIANSTLDNVIKKKRECEMIHLAISRRYSIVENQIKKEYTQNKRRVEKARSYYNIKSITHDILKNKRIEINQLKNKHGRAINNYNIALRELEKISDRIHAFRGQNNENSTVSNVTNYFMEDEAISMTWNHENEKEIKSEDVLVNAPKIDKLMQLETNRNSTLSTSTNTLSGIESGVILNINRTCEKLYPLPKHLKYLKPYINGNFK